MGNFLLSFITISKISGLLRKEEKGLFYKKSAQPKETHPCSWMNKNIPFSGLIDLLNISKPLMILLTNSTR